MLTGKLRTKLVGSGSSVSISDQNLQAMGFGTQTIVYRLTNTGLVQKVDNGVATTLGNWLLSGAASLYEVRVTDNDGNLTSGTTGTWLALSTTREWEITESFSGASVTTNLTVEIRLAAPPNTVLDTASVTLGVFVF